ncbi:uncharacterized protein LOC141902360 [Tubulanus polymorphus]|uniref:uncharacterized protein LOC141902360 n=1 Tax=Tubulanus polymorphus TaxID=672921 RepID=UPI003DA31840
MKWFISVAILSVLCLSVSAWFCKDDNDCESNECCGKYVVGWVKKCFDKGVEGEACASKGTFFGVCPCADGFYCEKRDNFFQRGEGICRENEGSGYVE